MLMFPSALRLHGLALFGFIAGNGFRNAGQPPFFHRGLRGRQFRRPQDGGTHQHQQLIAGPVAAAAEEQIAQDRNVLQDGNAAFVLVLFRADEPAEDDGVAIPDGDLGGKRALVGVGNIAHAGNGRGAVDVVNFLRDVHDHQSLGVDERRDIQRDAYLQLIVRGAGAAADAAVVINAGDVRYGVTHKKLRLLRLGGLNARTLDNVHVELSAAAICKATSQFWPMFPNQLKPPPRLFSKLAAALVPMIPLTKLKNCCPLL